ncbi:MAG: GTP cyclohydrolase [Capnocytophaga felis]|nr:GTP cyclohydrolase [Capnocytophaga felis]
MADILVKEVFSKEDLKQFVKFPFSLYKNHPYWVPPLINEELVSFNKTKNPAFENAEAFFYLAYNKKNEIVGRVAAIINQYDIRQNVFKIRFGWLDMIDDVNVTKALLDKVSEKGREHQLKYMEGPMGFSNMDKVGVMTEGYDHIASTVTWYNLPYYKEHLEQFGLVKEKGYIETYFLLSNVNAELFRKTAEAIRKRYQVRLVPANTKEEILKHVDAMFDLYNESYSKLSSYVPVSERQKDYFKKKFIPLINPEYIRFVENKDGKLICFAVVLPSFAKALQKAKGSLFPFGFWHLLKAKKKHDMVEFLLIGVTPEYQSKGIPALLFDYYHPVFQRNGINKCIITPELEDNLAIQQLWKSFQPVVYAKRATYKKDI